MLGLTGEKLWPGLLAVLFVAYWLSPHEWWPVLTFILLGVFYLARTAAKWAEYFHIQRRATTFLFGLVYLISGLALLVGALVAAPYPIFNFTNWRNVARALWAVALPFFAVAVYLECWWIYRRMKSQVDGQ